MSSLSSVQINCWTIISPCSVFTSTKMHQIDEYNLGNGPLGSQVGYGK